MGSNTSTTETKQELAPEQKKMLNLVMPTIKDYANTDLQLYDGLTTPGLNDTQKNSFKSLRKTANSIIPGYLDQATGQLDTANNTLGTAMDAYGSASDRLDAGQQYLQDAVGTADQASQWLGQANDASMDLYNKGFGMGSDILNAIADGTLGATQDASNFLLDPSMLSPDSNPWMEQYASAARQGLQDDFMQSVMPELAGQATASGQVGSSRAGIAQGVAAGNLSQDMSTLTADIYNQGYQNSLNALGQAYGDTIGVAGQAGNSLLDAGIAGLMMQPDLINSQTNLVGQITDIGSAQGGLANIQSGIAQGQAGIGSTQADIASFYPELAQLSTLPGEILNSIGAQKYVTEQARNTEKANKFMTEQQLPFLQAMDIANLAFGMPVGQTTSTSTLPGPNPLEIMMGLGSMFMGF